MLKDLNERIYDLRVKKNQKDKILKRLKKAENLLIKEKVRLGELKSQLNKEEQDVKNLECMSLTAIFHTVLGSKKQSLEKERQEFLAAKLRYDECHESVRSLREEKELLNSQLKELQNIDEEIDEVLREKQLKIAEMEDDQITDFLNLSEELANVESEVKELTEALVAGNQVKNELEIMLETIESVGDWGMTDLLASGTVTTKVNYSKIDDARAKAHSAQHNMRRFLSEMEDVSENFKPVKSIDVSEGWKLADYFFDGLIVDWVVQSKVYKAKANIEQIIYLVKKTINALQLSFEEVTQLAINLKFRRNELLEKL